VVSCTPRQLYPQVKSLRCTREKILGGSQWINLITAPPSNWTPVVQPVVETGHLLVSLRDQKNKKINTKHSTPITCVCRTEIHYHASWWNYVGRRWRRVLECTWRNCQNSPPVNEKITEEWHSWHDLLARSNELWSTTVATRSTFSQYRLQFKTGHFTGHRARHKIDKPDMFKWQKRQHNIHILHTQHLLNTRPIGN